MLARALAQLPPDLLETNAAFGGRVVEYALRLPGGRLLPDRQQVDGRRRARAAGDDRRPRRASPPARAGRAGGALSGRGRWRSTSTPSGRSTLAVLAVPDAVHDEVPEVRAEGWREGVLVVPYSLALPFVLSLYRLTVRFAPAPEHGGDGRPPGAPRRAAPAPGRRARGAAVPGPRPGRERPRCAARRPRARPAGPAGRLAGFDRPRGGGLVWPPIPCSRSPSSSPPAAESAWARVGPKAFLELAGQALVLRSARAFDAAPSVSGIVAVVPEAEVGAARALLAPVAQARRGGAGRRAAAGLGPRGPEAGARTASTASSSCTTPRGPLVDVALVEAVARAAAEAGAALPVLPAGRHREAGARRPRGRDPRPRGARRGADAAGLPPRAPRRGLRGGVPRPRHA